MGDSSKASDSSPAALGFLTVVENEQIGLVGGYLILNTTGRPLEFHCTAPVKPSRAQQILFGPTLTPYLYGEQIAQSLIQKGALEPLVVWTDQAAVLAARSFVLYPLALFVAEDLVLDEARRHFDTPLEFAVGVRRAAVLSDATADKTLVLDRMAGLENFDLNEPFGRIREAIEEAHRSAGARQAA